MIILPAIDIIDGKPVRLYQGDYDKKEIVANSVVETAMSFQNSGSEYIHIVDLDGAKKGEVVNKELIIKLAKELTIPIEVGGGIRTYETAKYLLENGVGRVILGTSAIEDKDLLIKLVEEFKEKIAVGIDCKDGYAFGRGWLEGSKLNYIDFSKEMEEIGVRNIIFTDISRDGTLEGPNLEMLEKLSKEVNIDITASGGIKDIEDIRSIKDLGLYGVITGKAIYSETLSLEEAIKVSKED